MIYIVCNSNQKQASKWPIQTRDYTRKGPVFNAKPFNIWRNVSTDTKSDRNVFKVNFLKLKPNVSKDQTYTIFCCLCFLSLLTESNRDDTYSCKWHSCKKPHDDKYHIQWGECTQDCKPQGQQIRYQQQRATAKPGHKKKMLKSMIVFKTMR